MTTSSTKADPTPIKPTAWQLSWPAVTADLIGLCALIFLFPIIRQQMVALPTRGAGILLFLFFAAAIAINRLKRLEMQSGEATGLLTQLDFTQNQPLLVGLGLIAGAIFIFIQAELNGLTGDLETLFGRDGYVHEGEITLYYSLGPAFMWFMVAAFYQAAFILPTKYKISPQTDSYYRTELLTLTVINFYLVAMSAYLATAVSIWFANPILQFLAALLLLGLIFDPARLRHSVKNSQWLPLITFTLLFLFALVLIMV